MRLSVLRQNGYMMMMMVMMMMMIHYITSHYITLYYIIFNRFAHSAGPDPIYE